MQFWKWQPYGERPLPPSFFSGTLENEGKAVTHPGLSWAGHQLPA